MCIIKLKLRKLFQNFGVTDVVLQRGKDVSAFCELSKIDYAGDKFGEVYTALMYATGRLFTNDAPSISPSDFKHGNALYCLTLVKTLLMQILLN